jgi:hypothetical protein
MGKTLDKSALQGLDGVLTEVRIRCPLHEVNSHTVIAQIQFIASTNSPQAESFEKRNVSSPLYLMIMKAELYALAPWPISVLIVLAVLDSTGVRD